MQKSIGGSVQEFVENNKRPRISPPRDIGTRSNFGRMEKHSPALIQGQETLDLRDFRPQAVLTVRCKMSALLGTCGKAATVHNGICAEITIGADGETVEISRVDRAIPLLAAPFSHACTVDVTSSDK
jgi:hypothetical protein